jgi:hypothetical protein
MNLRQLAAAGIVTIFCALGLSSSPAQNKDISISGDDQNRTIECSGGAVTVSGDDNRLTLKKECSSLTVMGDDNVITAEVVTQIMILGDDNTIAVDTVARINTTGDDNKVTWKKGVGGKVPETSNTGDDNTIQQVK